MQEQKVLDCFMELSSLTKIPRTGWIFAGVTEPESISDHCYETAVFAYIISKYIDYNFDMRKVLLMSLFHEIGEARLTDLPRRSKFYIGHAKHHAESEATKDILNNIADELVDLLEEFHNLSNPESRLVEAAEELQIIFKAMTYAKENHGDMSEYLIDTAKYNSQGFQFPEQIAILIDKKLKEYLNNKPYWEIGYKSPRKS